MTAKDITIQREWAAVSMILLGSIALAVLISVFGREATRAINDVRAEVKIHETLLLNARQDLKNNERALADVNLARQQLLGARRQESGK